MLNPWSIDIFWYVLPLNLFGCNLFINFIDRWQLNFFDETSCREKYWRKWVGGEGEGKRGGRGEGGEKGRKAFELEAVSNIMYNFHITDVCFASKYLIFQMYKRKVLDKITVFFEDNHFISCLSLSPNGTRFVFLLEKVLRIRKSWNFATLCLTNLE